MRRKLRIPLCAILMAVLSSSVSGQFRLFGPRSPRPTPQPMRKASEFISRQPPLKVNQSLLKEATQDNTHIVVSIPKQRAYLMIDDQVAADAATSRPRATCTCLRKTRIIILISTAILWTLRGAQYALESAPGSIRL